MKQLAGRYDNGATVDNEDAILASFQTRSAAIYHQTKHKKNIAYGESERETMDWLYSAKQHQGTLIFIHGGGNDSNLLIVFYVQIMPDDFVMQLHRF